MLNSISMRRVNPAKSCVPTSPPFALRKLTALSLCLVASVAWSAEAEVADGGADATQEQDRLEAVVITSQKRIQAIQTVPVSVSVLSGKELAAQHIDNYDDLSRAVPGVSFNSVGANEGLTNVTIRGVSSTSGSATVGLYLDDVSITTKNFYDFAAQPKFFDLQGIEVLRGPQGSLWGASSEGGTIRFIPVQPDMTAQSSQVSIETSTTQHGGINYGASALFNTPVKDDVFALRGSIYSNHESGYIDHFDQKGNLVKKGVNDEKVTSFHLLGKITPSDELTIKPAVFYQLSNTGDNSAFYPSMGLHQQNKQVRENGRDEMALGSLSIQQNFKAFDFTSVTGVFKRQFDRQEDGTYYNSTVFAQAFLDPLYPNYQAQNDAIIGNLASPVKMKTNYRQVSQEFRLSSPEGGKGPVQWVAGVYYAEQSIHNTDFQQIPGINTAFQSIYGMPMEQSLVQGAYGAPGLQLFPNDIDESDDRTYREKQTAIFGQVDVDLRPDWHMGLGARLVHANETFVSTEIGFYQIGNISPYNQSASFSTVTPKATLSHDLDENHKMYLSAGEGTRLGGPTGPIVYGPTSVCASDFAAIGQTSQPTKFNSDSLWTYEAGSKNVLADGQVTLNAAVFHTDWQNIQQQIYLPTCGYYFTSNVGNAAIDGGELELAALLTRNLALNMTLSRENARVTSSNNPATVAVGAHLIDVPDLTATLAATYGFSFGDGTRVSARAEYAFTGHSYGSYQVSNSNYYNPAYGVLNLNLMFTLKDFEITAFAKNALNNQTIIQRPEINTVVEGYTVRPRTIGMKVTAHF
ncbi:MAG: TonB-dependent receptor [Paucibacter sp.]|nr:TonB-dependent receptor [Roseateles sp.]